MTIKDRLELIKEDEIARLFRRKGRGQELFCLTEKKNSKFFHRVKKNGKWESFEGFPDESIIKQAETVNFYKKIDSCIEESDEEIDVRYEKDFLRPFR